MRERPYIVRRNHQEPEKDTAGTVVSPRGDR
jgi:hypothetical protein